MRQADEQGFTLMELLVAITILAAMALAMFAASRQMLSSQEMAEVRDDQQHAISFALNKMFEDFNAAFFVKSADLLGPRFEGEVPFLGKSERVDFASMNHLRFLSDVPETDYAEISYYLVNDPSGSEGRVLMRRESTKLDRDIETGGQAYPLLTGVRSLTFEYLPFDSEEYKSEWSTETASAGNRLPRAVRATLEVYLPEEEEPQTYMVLAPIRLQTPLAL